MSEKQTISVTDQRWIKKTIKQKDISYNISNEAMLMETHCSMFDYRNLPKSVNKFYLELFLQSNGCVVWLDDPDNGGILALEGSTADDLDAYGIGRNVIATSRNGKSYRKERDADCVVGYNNLTMSPCFDIFTDAQTLADIQTSIEFLIYWTRLSPIVRVCDEATKEKVVGAFKNIRKGIPATVVSKKILADFGIPDDITVENLTQPDFADKIQYTAKLYDDVLRWHMTRYGHATNGNSKMAQQTVDEVDSTVSQSMILPLSMLAARKEMIEKVNNMFDLDIEVELSGSWRAEVTAYEEMSGENNIDDSADDPDITDSVPDSTDDDLATSDNTDPDISDTAAQPETVDDAVQIIADALVKAADEITGNTETEDKEDEEV